MTRNFRTSLAVTGLALNLIAAPLLAQGTAGGTGTGGAGTTTGGTAGNAAMSGTMTPAATTVTTALQANFDRLFLLKAAQGNMAEVMTSQLALRKSRNEQVRRIAQMMIDGHSRANAELLPIVQRKGLPMPTFVGAMHAATNDQLNRLNGERFDQMYMAAQVEAHENSINLYQQELAMGRDTDARAYATRVLPEILNHAAMIYATAQAVRAPGSAERMAAFQGTPLAASGAASAASHAGHAGGTGAGAR
jgi:putative membrane protein